MQPIYLDSYSQILTLVINIFQQLYGGFQQVTNTFMAVVKILSKYYLTRCRGCKVLINVKND